MNAERRLRRRISLIWTDAPGIARMGVVLVIVFVVLILLPH
jgi:hypothetical protein